MHPSANTRFFVSCAILTSVFIAGCSTPEDGYDANIRRSQNSAASKAAFDADDVNPSPGVQAMTVTRGGKTLSMSPGFEYRNGDVITLGEGRYKNPLPINGAEIRIVGAGTDKTVLSGGLEQTAIRIATGSVLIENLKVLSPYVSVGKTATVTFFNVKVEGRPEVIVEGFKGAQWVSMGPRVNFAFSDFDRAFTFSSGATIDFRHFFNVLYSRYPSRGGFKPYSVTHLDFEYTTSSLDKSWVEKGDVNQLFSVSNAKLLNEDHTRVRTLAGRSVLEPSKANEFPKMLSLLKTERTKYMRGASITSADGKTGEDYLKKAAEARKRGNHFVELTLLIRAQELAAGKLESQVETLISKNRTELSRRYGCWTRFYDVKGKAEFHSRSVESTHYFSKVDAISKILVAMGSKSSNCVLQVNVVKNFFQGQDSIERIVSVEQQWKEDPAITAMRNRYEAAARQAAEDASKARFDASLGRLTSTAKQLQVNRNRIEDRVDGTYLVVNNKKLKNTAEADEKSYKGKIAHAKSLTAQVDSAGNRQVKDGTVTTSSYFRTFRNEIQYELSLKHGPKKTNQAFPAQSKNYNAGPCTLKEDSKSSNFAGIKASTDSCGVKSYSPDSGFKKAYIDQYLTMPTQEFLLAEIVPSLIQEAKKKHGSKDSETNRDGMILAQLMTGEDNNPDLQKKAEEVIGSSISMPELRALVFFYK